MRVGEALELRRGATRGRRPNRRTAWASAATALLLVLACGAGAAQAAVVSCGQRLTTSVVVENDLAACPGDGLVAGADGITIDLDGHTIAGSGSSSGPTTGVAFGTHADVTVRNGTVRGFGVGVTNMVSEDGSTGGRPHVVGLTITDVRNGMLVGGTGQTVVAFNTIASDVDGFGLVVGGSGPQEIAFNRVTQGIHANGSGLTVEHNDARYITLADSDHATVTDNTVRPTDRGFLGIDLSPRSFFTTVARNTVLGGTIDVTGSFTFVWRNRVVGSRSDGIRVHSLDQRYNDNVAVRDVVLLGNVVGYSARDGISVPGDLCGRQTCEQAALGVVVRHNTVRHNRDDGLDVKAPGTTVARNVARFNADLGIEGGAGVLDGGRNQARGNGNPLQCTVITCR